MKISANKLKGCRCLFETKEGMRYTLTFYELTKKRVIEKIKKGRYDYLFKYPEKEKPSKDNLVSIVNEVDYYRERFLDI